MNTAIRQSSAIQVACGKKPAWMNTKVCVVCGAPAAGVTGYIFYTSARTKIGAPFCKEHLDNHYEYANPVFENREALVIFQEQHPKLYLQRVKGKKILFLTGESGTVCTR